MRITTISITKSRTVNIGNFESVRVEFGLTAELDMLQGSSGDGYETAVAHLEEMVDKELAQRCPPSSVTREHKDHGQVVKTETVPILGSLKMDRADYERVSPKVEEDVAKLQEVLITEPVKRKRRTRAEIEAEAMAKAEAAMAAKYGNMNGAEPKLQASPNTGPASLIDERGNLREQAQGRTTIDGAPKAAAPQQARSHGATEASATIADVQAAMLAYNRNHGHAAMQKVLKDTCGVVSLASIPAAMYHKVWVALGSDPLK